MDVVHVTEEKREAFLKMHRMGSSVMAFSKFLNKYFMAQIKKINEEFLNVNIL